MPEESKPVKSSEAGPIPSGFQLAPGWSTVVPPAAMGGPLACISERCYADAVFYGRNGACAAHAIEMGAIVKAEPPAEQPASAAVEVPPLTSKLGERICDCGESEHEHCGKTKDCPLDQGTFSQARRARPSDVVLRVQGHESGWGVNCAWNECAFRTPEFTTKWAAREAISEHIKTAHLQPPRKRRT